MSLVFSNTTTKAGIIQLIERTLQFPDGHISGTTTRLREFTSEVNLALDRVLALIFEADGTWQFDDSNHTDFPIITTNLVDGQRDYTFTTDEGNNVILDIHRVFVLPSATSTKYGEVVPIDAQSNSSAETEGFWNGQNTEGVPYYYDKTANGIFLDPIPSYNATNGLKVYINREASYFAITDTTKKPGFAGIFHEYLVLRPAYTYAYRHQLATLGLIRDEMLRMEEEVKKYYARREKDVRHIMSPKKINYI